MTQEPWELHPGLWKSQAAFFTYLRGAIRRVWARYPAKLEWKQGQLTSEAPAGYKGRGKKFGKCAYCGGWHTASSLEVDHIQQAGECNSWETAAQFLRRLLDCNDNWCLACKPCHKVKSYAERSGIDFEEAKLQKRVIEFLKQDKSKVVEFCIKMGYNARSLTNADKRRAAVEEILRRADG